ncbi:MAG: DUF3048 C-terminal domain-containing protein [Acidimicrobiales bacterium]
MTPSTSHRTPARLVATLVAAGLVLAACGGDDDDAATTTTTDPTTTTGEEATTTTAPPIAPLTGEALGDDALRNRPALVVKVDSTPKALGRQDGLEAADLVFAEKVEGGSIRLAAVFHSTDTTVGPVRSARTSDIAITGNLNRPLFAFSGANGGVLGQVRAANLVDVGSDAAPRSYSTRGSGVLRFYVDTRSLYGLAPDGAGPPRQQLNYRAAGEPVVNAGAEPASKVTVRYPGRAGTTVQYIDEGMGWARVQDGVPHTVTSGTRIAPDNVIVQFIDYKDSGYRDVTGSASPEAVLSGEGDAWVFTGGSLIRARWSRADEGALTDWTDQAGAPVRFAPGSTWIELADKGSATLG